MPIASDTGNRKNSRLTLLNRAIYGIKPAPLWQTKNAANKTVCIVALIFTDHNILSIHTWAGTSYQGALIGSDRQGWYMGLMEA
jgi:hypothetical protein